MKFALAMECDGRGFAGTQVQGQGERTVQGELAPLLRDIGGLVGLPRAASRLDAGVSAAWLPFEAELPNPPGSARDPRPDPQTLARFLGLALAPRLPADLGVVAVAPVADDWHAQHDAARKQYRYQVMVRGTKPARDQDCWWIRQLDQPELLQSLANQLVGEQDLSRFACLRHDGSDDDDPRRTIRSATWTSHPVPGGTAWEFAIVGDGFLYKQIRGFVGAMIHVAQGRRSHDEFSALVAGSSSARLGNIAPPEGLLLERVVYDPEPPWMNLSPIDSR